MWPDIVLGALYAFTHLQFIMTLYGGYYYPLFKDEEIKTQRG